MHVEFVIQSHPERALMAKALAGKIPGSRVISDPDPDNQIRSPWRTYRHCLESRSEETTHLVVVQDDVVLCQGFAEAAVRALTARPDRLVAFFVGGNPYQAAREVMRSCQRDLPWAELAFDHWFPVVASAWPVELIPRLLEFYDRQKWSERFVSDDEIVGRFNLEIKRRPLATVPSLVEHPDMIPSLIGSRASYGQDPGRLAACFIGSDCGDCALEINWSRGPGG